jgi:Mrp family chromosome partitioning ATPase
LRILGLISILNGSFSRTETGGKYMEERDKELKNGGACSEDASCGACDSAGTCDAQTQQKHMEESLARRLSVIRRRIAVMSGKGGVGKSTVSVNLAVALAKSGRSVGILDGDIHGPDVPKMLGLDGSAPSGGPGGLLPLVGLNGVKVMSMAFLIKDADTPVAWRGPLKHSLFQQFLADVDWGDLDYLIVDLPPGTGDEALSVGQLIGPPLATIIVTTPQDVALLDARKSVVFAQSLGMDILGIVENMSGLVCPHCGETIDLFKTGGGERAAKDLGVPFLGPLPIDPQAVTGGDSGKPIVALAPESIMSRAMFDLAERIDSLPE